jgi:hypothetical protein
MTNTTICIYDRIGFYSVLSQTIYTTAVGPKVFIDKALEDPALANLEQLDKRLSMICSFVAWNQPVEMECAWLAGNERNPDLCKRVSRKRVS